jgi:predicted nucleic acid-binding Zn ribbon protein
MRIVSECVRCGKPVEAGRKKYCGDACRDSQQRDLARARPEKMQFPRHLPARRFDYRRNVE